MKTWTSMNFQLSVVCPELSHLWNWGEVRTVTMSNAVALPLRTNWIIIGLSYNFHNDIKSICFCFVWNEFAPYELETGLKEQESCAAAEPSERWVSEEFVGDVRVKWLMVFWMPQGACSSIHLVNRTCIFATARDGSTLCAEMWAPMVSVYFIATFVKWPTHCQMDCFNSRTMKLW